MTDMTEIPDVLVAFWFLATVFCVAVIAYIAWRNERLRREVDLYFEESVNSGLVNIEMRTALRRRLDHHRCVPPRWGTHDPQSGDWVAPELGGDFVCPCGVRYVLVARDQETPQRPIRLGWVTDTEARTGLPVAWDGQDPAILAERRLRADTPQSAEGGAQ